MKVHLARVGWSAASLLAWTLSAGPVRADRPTLGIILDEAPAPTGNAKGAPPAPVDVAQAKAATAPAKFAPNGKPSPPAQTGASASSEKLGAPAGKVAAQADPTAAPDAVSSEFGVGTGPGLFDWAKNPPVRSPVRPGFFAIPPTGCGAYSLMDALHHEHRDKPPRFPYAPSALMQPPFYDADFRYLEDPKNTQHDPFDALHRVHLGDDWLFATGGHTWVRAMRERGSRLSGKSNDYDLYRTTVFGDLWYKDRLRFYAAFIAAQSLNQDLKPLAIDRNYADVLDAFADLKIADINGKPAYLRVGRQEINLGSQRLVASPDWANTRRSFEGARAFRQGDKVDVDLFWLSPVKVDVSKLDSHDNNQNFAGAWWTYRPEKGQYVDLYYLFLDNTNKTAPAVGAPAVALASAPINVHTIGSRWTGDKHHFLWDAEAMLQLGERGDSQLLAGAALVGAGYHFAHAPMNPTIWLYYDWASGDGSPNAGDYNTFQQLFPFGHYYLGWLDLVGRQNIRDLNAHLYLFPTKWITLNAQYHVLRLDSARDALYNPAGAPTRFSPTGAAGTDVGNELDLIASIHIGPHADLLFGWSKLWAGDFIRGTGSGHSPESFYLLYNVRW